MCFRVSYLIQYTDQYQNMRNLKICAIELTMPRSISNCRNYIKYYVCCIIRYREHIAAQIYSRGKQAISLLFSSIKITDRANNIANTMFTYG